MQLIDFLNLDQYDLDNTSSIFSFALEILDNCRKTDFSNENIHILSGVMDKFVDMAHYYGVENCEQIKIISEEFISSVIKNSESTPIIRRNESLMKFEKLHSLAVSTYNKIIKNLYTDSLAEFALLYHPETADKNTAIKLITDAINIIKNDRNLNKRQRNQIISALNKALSILQKDSPDWTVYFGTVQQVIIILGAIGSLVGGIAGVAALKQANDKIIGATNIIIETSVTKNIQINDTIINNIQDIHLYSLPESVEVPPKLSLPGGSSVHKTDD